VKEERDKKWRKVIDDIVSTTRMANRDITQSQAEEFAAILWRRREVFAIDEVAPVAAKLPRVIDTAEAAPVRIPPRPLSYHKQLAVEEEMRKLVENGLVERSDSPWGCPIVLARKADGSWRFCCDYRALNIITSPIHHPLPIIEHQLSAIGNNTIFSTMDCQQGFWQLSLCDEDKRRTAFAIAAGKYKGVWEWNRLPFGLKNAPAAFQHLMDIILNEYIGQFLLVYIDDLIVYASNIDQHLQRLDIILCKLQTAHITLKPTKCQFLRTQLTFLGYTIDGAHIKPQKEKIDIITAYPEPRTPKEVKQFLGVIGYYQRYIYHYSTITQPLRELAGKEKEWKWTEKHTLSFNTLKEALQSYPILRPANPHIPYIIYTDASQHAIAGVLSQKDEQGNEYVISYCGRSLSEPEKRYSATDRELLAVIVCMRRWEAYLWGAQVTVVTDHRALQYMLNERYLLEGPRANWLLKIQHLNITATYRAGRYNQVDGLSRIDWYQSMKDVRDEDIDVGKKGRRKARDNNTDNNTDSSNVSALTRADRQQLIKERVEQATDIEEGEWISDEEADNESSTDIDDNEDEKFETIDAPVTDNENDDQLEEEEEGEVMVESIPETEDEWIRHQQADNNLFTSNQYISTEKGLRIRIEKDEIDGERQQLAVPTALRTLIMHHYHHPAHLSAKHMTHLIRQTYHWTGMESDITAYVNRCSICATHSIVPTHTIPINNKWREPGTPMSYLSMDIVGPLPLSRSRNAYILTVMCLYSRYLIAIPLRTINTKQIATALIDRVFLIYGTPQHIVSDNGSNFISKLAQHLYRALGINKHTTIAYRPQSNGQIERAHRSLKETLAKICEERKEEWDIVLPIAAFTHNSRPSRATGYAPFYIVFNRQPKWPFQCHTVPIQHNNPTQQHTNKEMPKTTQMITDYIDSLRQRITVVRDNIRQLWQKEKDKADEKMKEKRERDRWKIVVGDQVWSRVHVRGVLQPRWEGPYEVMSVSEDGLSLSVKRKGGRKLRRVHRSQVKKAYQLTTATEG